MKRALAALACLTGCSFVFTDHAARPRAPDEPVHCTTSYFPPVADLVGVAIGGLLIAAPALDDTPAETPADGVAALAAIITGSIVVLVDGASAIYGFSAVRSCRRARGELARLQREHDGRVGEHRQARERAWERTKAAAAAARAGDCATVISIESEVKALDIEVHATAFARDAAIARCLTAASGGP